jgi:Na+/melibiose symporter-like transporter
MKKLGYLMIIIAFLAGSLAAVVDADKVQWHYFTAALVVGAAGIVLVRVSLHKVSRAEGRLADNMQAIETSLSRIVNNITQFNIEKHSIDTYEIRHRIDELFIEDLDIFIQARESITHIYGLSVYADVMSCFAAGERYLNRVWSASADGYIDEVNTYLEKAQEQFAESLNKVKSLGRV